MSWLATFFAIVLPSPAVAMGVALPDPAAPEPPPEGPVVERVDYTRSGVRLPAWADLEPEEPFGPHAPLTLAGLVPALRERMVCGSKSPGPWDVAIGVDELKVLLDFVDAHRAPVTLATPSLDRDGVQAHQVMP